MIKTVAFGISNFVDWNLLGIWGLRFGAYRNLTPIPF